MNHDVFLRKSRKKVQMNFIAWEKNHIILNI